MKSAFDLTKILDYLHKVCDGNWYLAIPLALITWLFFPDTAYLVGFFGVLLSMIIDILTKRYSIMKPYIAKYGSEGRRKARQEKAWSSHALKEGFKAKILTILAIGLFIGLLHQMTQALSFVAVISGSAIYIIFFLVEWQSILENLEDAGLNVGWLIRFVRKKKEQVMETSDEEGEC